MFAFTFTLVSCNNKENINTVIVSKIAIKQAESMNIVQLIDGLLIIAENDTTMVCKSLVMPKPTLIRIASEQTFPNDFAERKVRELYVQSIVSGKKILEKLNDENSSDKDWLIDNSINEPLNAIWEQIVE